MNHRYIVDRRLDAPAEAILAAIREAAAGTRFTDLPKPVRAGANGIKVRVRGTRFTVRLDSWSEGGTVDLRGVVVSEADGATRVHATAENDRYAGVLIAGLAVLSVLLWLFRVDGAGAAAILAALVGIATVLGRAFSGAGDARAAYLGEWLNGVLERLPALPPADVPGSAARIHAS